MVPMLGPLAAGLAYELVPEPLARLVAGLVLVLWTAGGMLPQRRPRGGLVTLAAALLLLAGHQPLLADPLAALATLGLLFASLSLVWLPSAVFDAQSPLRSARRSVLVLITAVVAVVIAGRASAPVWTPAIALSATIVVVAALREFSPLLSRPRRASVIAGMALGAVAASLAPAALRPVALAAGLSVSLFALRTADEPLAPLLAWVTDHPARLVVGTFLGLSLVGALLLALPVSAGAAPISLLDAAFTAVSAVCVTGLIVLDTPTAFSASGQVAILLLIQVGGLGIMTFYAVALRAFGRRLGMRHELTVAGALSVQREGHFFGALRRVLVLTFSVEAAGALLLFATFWRDEAALSALWRAVFTAVSAFCNAGFALQSDSLVPYQDRPLVLHVVALLIVLGGLSPLAVASLGRWWRGGPVALQSRLIVLTSAALLVTGFVAFLAFEWTATLGALSTPARLHNAWFQSVTLRTAGFNSVDLGETSGVTRALMLAMMFIGGSPGGTAGGIKTTTAAVLLLAVVAALRGQDQITAFGRRIRHTSVYRAVAVVTSGLLSVLAGFCALLLTQRLAFESALFETVSAIGTVGLSLGATASLDQVGKVVIMLCMFLGRVGPLTLFLFLADRRTISRWKLPDEDVDVG